MSGEAGEVAARGRSHPKRAVDEYQNQTDKASSSIQNANFLGAAGERKKISQGRKAKQHER